MNYSNREWLNYLMTANVKDKNHPKRLALIVDKLVKEMLPILTKQLYDKGKYIEDINIDTDRMVVVARLEGNIMALRKIINANKLHRTTYIFMGPFVEDKKTPIDCLLMMLLLKCMHKNRVHILPTEYEFASWSPINEEIQKFLDVCPFCVIANKHIFMSPFHIFERSSIDFEYFVKEPVGKIEQIHHIVKEMRLVSNIIGNPIIFGRQFTDITQIYICSDKIYSYPSGSALLKVGVDGRDLPITQFNSNVYYAYINPTLTDLKLMRNENVIDPPVSIAYANLNFSNDLQDRNYLKVISTSANRQLIVQYLKPFEITNDKQYDCSQIIRVEKGTLTLVIDHTITSTYKKGDIVHVIEGQIVRYENKTNAALFLTIVFSKPVYKENALYKEKPVVIKPPDIGDYSDTDFLTYLLKSKDYNGDPYMDAQLSPDQLMDKYRDIFVGEEVGDFSDTLAKFMPKINLGSLDIFGLTKTMVSLRNKIRAKLQYTDEQIMVTENELLEILRAEKNLNIKTLGSIAAMAVVVAKIAVEGFGCGTVILCIASIFNVARLALALAKLSGPALKLATKWMAFIFQGSRALFLELKGKLSKNKTTAQFLELVDKYIPENLGPEYKGVPDFKGRAIVMLMALIDWQVELRNTQLDPKLLWEIANAVFKVAKALGPFLI